jgi:RNA polymerase sigma-70 factor (ECF subfamily)
MMIDESPQTVQWLERLRAGEKDALAVLFDHYRPRLRNMVQLRLDARVAARFDASDVLQEVYLDVAQQIGRYIDRPQVSFYIWLRGLTWERLLKLHRSHLGTARRAVVREQPLPAESSAALAGQLLAGGVSPSDMMVRDELRRRIQNALARLAPEDREVILMRDFEDMSNNEVAEALGLGPSGVTMRYGRAMYRLKEILVAEWPQGESQP